MTGLTLGMPLTVVVGSRSPQRYIRGRDRFFRSYDQIEWGDRNQRAQELLADFEDILLQISGDFLSKEEALRSLTPMGIHLEDLPTDFSYVKRKQIHLLSKSER